MARTAVAAWTFGAVLALVAALNFLHDLDDPHGTFWDENYYVTAAARYAEGRPQFASHPPLGLMLIAAGDRLSGANRGVDQSALARVKRLSDAPQPRGYRFGGVRLMSALFAVGAVLEAYAILLALTRRPFLSVAGASLLAFETAFAAHFRAAHLDAFQLAFALAAVCAAVGAWRAGGAARWAWLSASGAAAGAAAMVKLDGVLLLAPAGLIVLQGLLARDCGVPQRWAQVTAELAILVGTVCIIGVVVLLVQLVSCRRPLDYGAPAAATDARFVSRTYQLYLDGRLALSPAVVAAAATDHLSFMVNDMRGIGRWDANGSSPLLQPFGDKPINYRWDSHGGRTRYVQLVPNPVNWAVSFAALVGCAGWLGWALTVRGRAALGDDRLAAATGLLGTASLVYFVHAWIGAHRVMYLYHYFIPFTLGLLAWPLVLAAIAARLRWTSDRTDFFAGVVLAASVAAFAWWSPLAYHRPLSAGACEARDLPFHMVNCRN